MAREVEVAEAPCDYDRSDNESRQHRDSQSDANSAHACQLSHPEHSGHGWKTHSPPAGHLLHHLLHLAELIEEPVYVADRTATAPGDAGAAGTVDDRWIPALFGGHRKHDRLDVFHALRIRLHLLLRFRVHTRQHFQDSLQPPPPLDLAHAMQEIAPAHAV